MLARTPKSLVYLSADELGITERERAGLIEVRDDLASGRVKHVPVHGEVWPLEESDTTSMLFSMGQWHGSSECGTAHCIKGFMQIAGVYSMEKSAAYQGSHKLECLFEPFDIDDWRNLNTEHAVRAIDHFLAGAGAECWPLALADESA